jgi:hypothetical protein
LTRRGALAAAAAGAIGLGRAGAEDKRSAAVLPKLSISTSPATPVAGKQFTVAVKADATNPKQMGLIVCDLSRKGKKAIRQTYSRATILPGQTATFTFTPAATDDKKISIRVIAWDKEHPPQKGDDIRKVLFRERRVLTFA